MANGDRLYYNSADYNGRMIHELGDPVDEMDAVNKRYVDAKVSGGGGAAALGDLTDVDVTAYPPGPGDQLVWWPEQQMWVPAPRQRVTNLFPMNVATGTTTAGTVDGFSAKVGNGVIASVTEPRWRDVYRSLQIECTPGMNSPEVEIVPVRFPAGTAKIGYSFYLYAESAGEGQFTSIAGGGVWLDDQGQHVNSVGSGRPVKAADAGTWVRHVWSLTPPPGATQFRPKITVNGLGTTGHPVVFVSGLQVQVGEVTPWVADSGGPAIADASDVVVDEVHAPDGAVLTWSAGAGVWIAAEPAAGGGVSGPTITAQGDATQSSGRLEVQDAGAAYPTWHVYSEGPKTVMGWGDGTSAPSYQIGFQLAEYGDTVVTGSNLRTQRALELQTPSDWTIHRLEATPETVTLDGSPIMTEAALASLVDEVAALKAEVQVLRSRLGDGA